MSHDVRERSREILRAELADAAADFCAENGFDEVTVDEIAHGIGVSRATFFRYFGSKEDAIVTAVRVGRQDLPAVVRASTPAPGTSLLDLIRGLLEPTVVASRVAPARLRARLRMVGVIPALRGRLAADRAAHRNDLAQAIADRGIADRAVALSVALVALTATELAWTLWAEDADADLGDCFDRSFELVQRAGGVSAAS
ncbi:TetR family transcriptional regulator [Microbacterium sp. NPDC089189]|uniref:TetR family transcriptional regulator n=1 Tax=Microbacterium sp. NPDC089189 TaxID=3154972 RepID=UPI00343BF3E8